MGVNNSETRNLLGFNNSQDVINLQTKYTLFKRVVNIVFSVTCDGGFDPQLMTDALNRLYERNDCMRLTFVKDGKQTKQYFEAHRTVGMIPTVHFETYGKMEAFINRFRRKPTNAYKGDVLRVVYAVNPEGKQIPTASASSSMTSLPYTTPSNGVRSFLPHPAVSRRSSARTTNTAPRRPARRTKSSSATTSSTATRSTRPTAERTATRATSGSRKNARGNSRRGCSSSAAAP